MKITTLQQKTAASFIVTTIKTIKQTQKCKIKYSGTNEIKFLNKSSNFLNRSVAHLKVFPWLTSGPGKILGWIFVSDWPQISSQTSNIYHRIQRYLSHRAKVRHAIPKNLVMQRMTCMP